MPRPIARVQLDSPLPQLDRLFDYEIPAEMAVESGIRVRVPLRTAGRMVDALVVETDVEDDPTRSLSAIAGVVSPVPVLTPKIYQLARTVADRAAGGVADVLRLAIPKRQVRVENTWLKREESAWVAPSIASGTADLIESYPGLTEVIASRGRAAVEVTCVAATSGKPTWPKLFAAVAAFVLSGGKSAILAVPDHRDLDLLVDALKEVLPEESIVRSDSRLGNADRYRSFLCTLQSEPCVVVGNRSALYAPVDAALIALWDDGDPLYAEPLAPYVHARDVALIRGEQEGSALLFASHTRSTDAERLVLTGWLKDLKPSRRQAPKVSLSSQGEMEQPGVRISSGAFRVLREGLNTGPVLVQVARPGFSPSLICASCRHSARCNECGGPLGASRRGAVPTCGWCGRTASNWSCSKCSSTSFQFTSSGSERTAQELGRAFPGVRIVVADADHPIAEVEAESLIVVATRNAEPIAKGGYRSVVLLDGARMLQAPNLRIGEHCLRWWSNAAALAAPGASIHLVGVTGPVARAFASWSHSAYARKELAERASLRMPPTVRTALIEGHPESVSRAVTTLSELELGADAVLGPVPIQAPKPADEGRVRALVRFDYNRGQRVASTLRAVVVSEAMARRARSQAGSRTTLSVRFDMLDPEL